MEALKGDKKTVRSILGLTESLIETCGTRAAGTKGSVTAAEELAGILRHYCDRVYVDSFSMHPGALNGIGRAISLAYVLSLFLFFLGGAFVYAAAGICVLVLVYSIVHFFFYGTLFDGLFRKKTGLNAVGVIEPAEQVRRQVIVAGHHDSSYVFGFFSRFERLAGLRFLLAVLFYIFITVLAVMAAWENAFFTADRALNGASLWVALAGLLFTVPMFFFVSKKVSPGAGDNLNGSSIAVHVGRYFSAGGGAGALLRHTRLVVLSTDGEEAGQRGAMDFAKRHREELFSVPTRVINIDSVYNLKDLAVLIRDRHGLVPLSRETAAICRETASETGVTLKTVRVPFGSGTDAAAFAKAGIEAVTIIGMPTSLFCSGRAYHTVDDSVERIEPEAVEAVFNIVANCIVRLDRME